MSLLRLLPVFSPILRPILFMTFPRFDLLRLLLTELASFSPFGTSKSIWSIRWARLSDLELRFLLEGPCMATV